MEVSPPDSSSSARRVREAEADAARTITRAREQALKADQDGHAEIERIKEDYTVQKSTLAAREDEGLQDEQAKGYERVRESQRKAQAELSRVRNEGDKKLEDLKGHYQEATYAKETKGNQDLKHLEQHDFELRDGESKRMRGELDQMKAEHTQMLRYQQENLDEATEAQKSLKDQWLGKLREHNDEVTQLAMDHFQSRYADVTQNHDVALRTMDARASQTLQNIREQTERKLGAYAVRQQDPFYQMVDTQARLEENEGEFVLTAQIPQHEQDHVSVSVRGDQLVLNGARRSNEKMDLDEAGRSRTTASYQNYTEVFPLRLPVEARGVSKEFQGGQLVVRIPKKVYAPPPPPKKEVARAQYERPRFPDNLPVTDAPKIAVADEPAPPAHPSRAGHTLT